jgi:hypothetical protein
VFSEALGSDELAADIAKRARELGVAIYPVLLPAAERLAYPNEQPTRPNFFSDEAGVSRFLKLADATGGQPIRANPLGDDFVSPVLEALGAQLQFDYLVSFRPKIVGAGKQHEVRVALRSRQRGRVLGGSAKLVY